jgi:hypothetical protein
MYKSGDLPGVLDLAGGQAGRVMLFNLVVEHPT